jgi:hypothetical protein
MNDNPWRVDDVARLRRHRIQDEMKWIRLEDSALADRKSKPNGAAIMEAAVGVSLLLAAGLTYSMVFAIGILR